ncbi:MAG: ECF transporter S component, partial [Candidatus Geothermarchaeales archaeon]
MGAPSRLPTRARRSVSLFVSLSAVFTGVVFAATVVFSLFIPGSGGFFNIGESGVYLAALVAGPYVGSVAGGIGSMLADLFLGFPAFAPGTLVIKGAEGFVVGYLAYHTGFRRLFRSNWMAAVVSLPLAALLFFLGNAFYVGPADVEVLGVGLSTHIVPALWAVVAIALV